ncbi:MAG: 2-aminoethylphosphonate aminotransferase [Gammaproteobacteria bacterium]|nr:2-aminoethylphosphonate aminotransferase [Gammaproteobacteria bacterium]
MSKKWILLNPGPVTLTESVRAALTRDDWCHRETEFASLTQSINERIAGVYEESSANYASVLLTGSGTLAVESMLTTFAPRDSKTLVVTNGVYGERMEAMLRAKGRPVVTVNSAWEAPMDLESVEAVLRADQEVSHVLAVHHETTTARLNDLDGLGKLCRDYDRALLLDAVSSFGAERISFDDWNLAALAATANKCIHGVPGLSFVLARRDLYAEPDPTCGSVYLDANRYFRTQHGDGYSPFTLSVQVAFALDTALDELAAGGGWKARGARYAAVGKRVRDELARLGIEPFIPADDFSAVMASYRLPEGIAYEQMHDDLKARGFIVYAGQGHFSSSMFRIAHMGAIADADVDRLLAALREFFADN